jgi:hypothetical protein
MTGVPSPFRSRTNPILEAKSDMSRIGKVYYRCIPAFKRNQGFAVIVLYLFLNHHRYPNSLQM